MVKAETQYLEFQQRRYLLYLQIWGVIIAAIASAILFNKITADVLTLLFIVILADVSFIWINNELLDLETKAGAKEKENEPSSVDVLFRDSIELIHRDAKGNVKKIIKQ